MAFRILDAEHLESFEIRQAILNPAEAELHVLFRLTRPALGAELRGRLHGPRCAYSSTIEIAYPLRPVLRQSHEAANVVLGRIVIPEPSLWDPVAPFLYEGNLELWAEGHPLARVQVLQGLRSFQLSRRGLRWNGQPLLLHAVTSASPDEAALRQLRGGGANALLLPAGERAPAVCDLADRLGLAVLAEADGSTSKESIAALQEHAGFLGWLIDPDRVSDPQACGQFIESVSSRHALIGVRWRPGASEAELARAAFVCCAEAEGAHPELPDLPRLVVRHWPRPGEEPAQTSAGVMGYLAP